MNSSTDSAAPSADAAPPTQRRLALLVYELTLLVSVLFWAVSQLPSALFILGSTLARPETRPPGGDLPSYLLFSLGPGVIALLLFAVRRPVVRLGFDESPLPYPNLTPEAFDRCAEIAVAVVGLLTIFRGFNQVLANLGSIVIMAKQLQWEGGSLDLTDAVLTQQWSQVGAAAGSILLGGLIMLRSRRIVGALNRAWERPD